jgi:hypothetical protein
MLVRAAEALIASGAAHAGEEEPLPQSVVITAQKQERTADSVGMSIMTDTGDALRARGIEDVQDLPQLVPGLTIHRLGRIWDRQGRASVAWHPRPMACAPSTASMARSTTTASRGGSARTGHGDPTS